jgi:hypothetical protein
LPFDTEILADLIGRKHHLLSQVRQLGRKQLELIEVNDLTQLLKLLASKQKILTELQSIERQLDPFRAQDPETRIWRSAGDRDRCARIAAECETLRTEIFEAERTGESRLALRRDEAALQLQGLHQASQVRHAYAQPPQNERRQLDLSSEG